MSSGPERLEQAIYHGEQYVRSLSKQLLGQIHHKIYRAVENKDQKRIHYYFRIMNETFPQLHSKVFNPTTMNNFFQSFGRDKLGHGLEHVAGITVYFEDQEVGVPCVDKDDNEDIIIVTGQWLRKSYDLETKSVSSMVAQEVRTLLKDIMRSLCENRLEKPAFMFELERILIQMV